MALLNVFKGTSFINRFYIENEFTSQFLCNLNAVILLSAYHSDDNHFITTVTCSMPHLFYSTWRNGWIKKVGRVWNKGQRRREKGVSWLLNVRFRNSSHSLACKWLSFTEFSNSGMERTRAVWIQWTIAAKLNHIHLVIGFIYLNSVLEFRFFMPKLCKINWSSDTQLKSSLWKTMN